MAGIGPGRFAGMMLADHGAEVIRIEDINKSDEFIPNAANDALLRSRKIVPVVLSRVSGQG
jgi:alpha-methylacyl-CoA racemase